MKWFCRKNNKVRSIENKKNSINVVYHGTLNDFNPSEIKSPSWFSIEEDQSVKWIFYKYKKNNCSGLKTGYLHKFIVKNSPKLLDVNMHSDCRLEINANGNYSFSQKILNGEYGDYDGYINLEDQAEIMLCNPSKHLEIHETTKIQIEKVYPVNYQKTANGWRL